ncbi:blue copper protein-like [Oryza brachyantha]|uniref:Phytocyanin domain-containing protein n=1 Tax=Oryza brachyantha TaxID=4533 RepID=J3MTX4_ORYBR|nr:blue copper protein-like [Oryza brachyantha]
MAASSSVLIKLLVLVGCALAASAATTHTVGGSAGWSTGQTYDTWASGQTFAVGDKLVFNFAGGHTVTEVTKSDYEACSVSGNPISDTTTGPATIDLTSAGAHYYICTVAGHCTGGMKLAITVGSGSVSGTPPSTTPGSGTPPTTPSSSKPNGASASLQASAVAAAAAGVLVKLALF